MKQIIFSLGAVVLLMGMTVQNNQSVEWQPIADAFTLAEQNQKLILVDLYTDWCGWCKRMDRDTYADAGVAGYLSEKFISVKMNPEKEGTLIYNGKSYTQREFGQALGITGYPATAFFNEKGELLTIVPGYHKPDQFMKFLRFFGEDAYKTMSWEDFSKAES